MNVFHSVCHIEQVIMKSRNLLRGIQANPDLYFDSLREGIWIPIAPINSIAYEIMVGPDEKADGRFEDVFVYEGFNPDVEDGNVWIGSSDSLTNFKVNKFEQALSDRLSYQTLDGETLYNGFRIKPDEGKYPVTISGDKKHVATDTIILGYGFDFQPTSEFVGYEDPREDDNHSFNLGL